MFGSRSSRTESSQNPTTKSSSDVYPSSRQSSFH
jgi:hypothetical protein